MAELLFLASIVLALKLKFCRSMRTANEKEAAHNVEMQEFRDSYRECLSRDRNRDYAETIDDFAASVNTFNYEEDNCPLFKEAWAFFGNLYELSAKVPLRGIFSIEIPKKNLESGNYFIEVVGFEGDVERFEYTQSVVNSFLEKQSILSKIEIIYSVRNVDHIVPAACPIQIGTTIFKGTAIGSRRNGRLLSGSVGLILRRKVPKDGLRSLLEDLAWDGKQKRFAIVTAAHVCSSMQVVLQPLSENYHREVPIRNGYLNHDIAILELNDVRVDAFPNMIGMYCKCNFSDRIIAVNGVVENIVPFHLSLEHDRTGFIDYFVRGNVNVFFCGQFTHSYGRIIGLSNHPKNNMIKCSLPLTRGDSGGLLFCQSPAKKFRLVAIGILNCVNEEKMESFFTPLSEFFDYELFELA
jgi:hypothetical protein